MENKLRENKPNDFDNKLVDSSGWFADEISTNKRRKNVKTSNRIQEKSVAVALEAKKQIMPAPKKNNENILEEMEDLTENNCDASIKSHTTHKETEKEIASGVVRKRMGSGKIEIGFQTIEKVSVKGQGMSSKASKRKGEMAINRCNQKRFADG